MANKKSEDQFNVCNNKNLTGDQGTMISFANVKNLMLKKSLPEAVRQKQFTI